MPISTTSERDILRVVFGVHGESDQPGRYESEIVCFLRIGDGGLETTYSHHVIRSRESTVGPFTQEIERRMSLTPALKAVITAGVMHEFWSAFSHTLRISAARIGNLPTETDPEPMDPRLA